MSSLWLVEAYRRELHAHYYRMTDSLDDADD
jgi:DNA-directed RNA polymerase specialized sigma24 family protein